MRNELALSRVEAAALAIADGRSGCVLFGHSAGGQFVHRMALFLRGSRATTMQDVRAARVRQALVRPLTPMQGTAGVDERREEWVHTAAAGRQGANRYERGRAHSGPRMSRAAARTLFGKAG